MSEGEKARVRFWLRGSDKLWTPIGLQILRALHKAKIPVRAIFSTLYNGEEAQLEGVLSCFRTELADDFLNVVVGFADDFHRLYTPSVKNYAITSPQPRELNPSEMAGLERYDIRGVFVDPTDAVLWGIVERVKKELEAIK